MLVSRLIFKPVLLGLCLAGMTVISSRAAEKAGMPDLAQEEETCLPTSTTNLIVWFGQHGYPKLIVKGDSAADGYIHTVHALMTATNATYQMGTNPYAICGGINKYIQDAGYSADVEYRGLDWSKAKYPDIVKDPNDALYKKNYKTPVPFAQDWLLQNDDPQKGFILLLAYVKFDQNNNTFTDAINAGHAVTLVNATPDMILIHDTAHDIEPGRKVLSPDVLTGGSFQLPGYNAPVAGLMLLSGTEMWAPPGGTIMLTGAVCITMHPDKDDTSVVKSTASAPGKTIGGGTGTAPSGVPATTPTNAPKTADASWAMWLFSFFFSK